ncbi:MAG: PHP domain-containing protein [Alphaproteobacteria bacterium]|nr:PHP domain-containing protein [Alphaproteobacteria bacterium]
MIQNFTLHTHTAGFDGRHSESEMITRAADMGFDTIGISNHFIVHPDIRRAHFYIPAKSRKYDAIYSASFDEVIPRFIAHYERLERAAENAKINVLRGMEVDFFDTPQWYHGFESALRTLRPDYIICACHFIEFAGGLCNVHDMANAGPDIQKKMLAMYWQKIRTAAASGIFSWMAHIDLPKKVGLGADEYWGDAENKTVSALAKCKIPVEINTGGKRIGVPEPYPSARIMRMIANNNVPVLLSDDAHSCDQIGRDFESAHVLAQKCGIKNFLTLQKILDFSNKTL